MFRKFKKAALFAAACAVFAGPAAMADDRFSVLIVGDDGDIESVPRNSDVFRHLVLGVATAVEASGYAAWDESATGNSDDERVSRRPAELVALSEELANASVDVVTAITFYARAVAYPDPKDTSLTMDVSGRLFRVPDAKWIGQYEINVEPGDLPPAPADCDKACIPAFLNEQAERVGADVGAQLATRLQLIAPPQ